MVGSYEEFASIKRTTLKRETLADAEQSAYLKFVRPTEAVTPSPDTPTASARKAYFEATLSEP
jgi:hypothetical protein